LPYCFSEFGTVRSPNAEPIILFVGGFAHPPNQEAVFWFVDTVLPLVRSRVPKARVSIVGSNPSSKILALASDTVAVAANVSAATLREHYRGARVAVVPLRYGAGVKLKVVEALREGVPLVTTPIGAQGLPGLEHEASICDAPADFAEVTCRLLLDDDVWRERCATQIAYAAARYSEAAFRHSLLAALGADVPMRSDASRASVA
jgi:glycosyltransferase involved in cell wall biosynthesis